MGNGQQLKSLNIQFLPFKQALLDPSVIAVISATLFAPMIIPHINKMIDTIPFLRDHVSLASVIAGVGMFGIVTALKIPPLFKAVLVGISGSFILTAVLPLYTQITTRGSQ